MSARRHCPHCHGGLPEPPSGLAGVSICPSCRANLTTEPVILDAPREGAAATKTHPTHRRRRTKPLSKTSSQKVPTSVIVAMVAFAVVFAVYVVIMVQRPVRKRTLPAAKAPAASEAAPRN